MEGDIRKNINKFRDLNFDLEQWTKDIVKSGVNKPMIISETSLNRIEKWINEKQIAGISAFREKLENVTPKTYLDFEKGHIYTKKQNIKRNMLLKSALLKLGYGATLVPGMSIERDRKVKEQSFVVVNLEDDPNFKENLLALGEAFNQDTVLFKDKNDDDAYLVGTNAVGYGIETPIGPFHENVTADFMSFIKNKGVAFGKKEDMTPPTRTRTTSAGATTPGSGWIRRTTVPTGSPPSTADRARRASPRSSSTSAAAFRCPHRRWRRPSRQHPTAST